MERDHGRPAQGAASFHTTRWAIVMRAAQNQTLGGQSALAQLCRNYWYPLYMYVRRRRHSPDDAQDLTQGFFLHLLEHRTTGAVKTPIHRLRKRYTTLLREEVGRTVSDSAEVDEEIHALCDALIASEGRLSQ